MKKTDLQRQSKEIAQDAENRLDDLEMLNLIELGIEDFRLGRTLSQRQVRNRLQKKHTVPVTQVKKGRDHST